MSSVVALAGMAPSRTHAASACALTVSFDFKETSLDSTDFERCAMGACFASASWQARRSGSQRPG